MQKKIFFLASLLILSQVVFAQSTSGKLLQSLKQHSTADTNRIKILLNLSRSYYDSEWNYANKAKVDSALPYLQQARQISNLLGSLPYKHKSLLMLGEYYFRCDNINQANYYFKQAITSARLAGEKELEADAWYGFAERTPLLDSLLEKKTYRYQQSLLLYKALNNPEKQILNLQSIARDHLDQGKYKLAEEELTALLQKQKKLGTTDLSTTYYLLTSINGLKGNYNIAINQALKALKNIKPGKDLSLESRINSKLGRWYLESGQIATSLKYDFRALEIMQEIPDPNVHQKFSSYILLRQIAEGLINLNKPQEALAFIKKTNNTLWPQTDFAKQYVAAAYGDCYTALKQYQLAESYYLQAIKKAKQLGRTFDLQKEYFRLANLSVKRGQYTKAYQYINSFFAQPHDTKNAVYLKDIYLMQFKIDSASSNLPSAIQHFQKHKALNDSIFSEKKSKQINELQIKYETSQKEQNILLLQTKARHQQHLIEKANHTKWIILGGVFMLLAALGILLYAYNNKKKNNILLRAQQREINQKNQDLQCLLTEKDNLLVQKSTLLIEKEWLLEEKEWLLKEIHHRVKNNLQIIIGLLYSQLAHLKDSSALKAIKESQQRIYSIALIHQKLYQSNNLDVIAMQEYILELIQYMTDSLDFKSNQVKIAYEIGIINMNIGQAIPVGLIINEAVTNAIKYAFPAKRQGLVTIKLTEKNNLYELSITDNGIGLPADYNPYTNNALGLTLIQGLSRQLQGTCMVNNDNGVSISVNFMKQKEQPLNSESITI